MIGFFGAFLTGCFLIFKWQIETGFTVPGYSLTWGLLWIGFWGALTTYRQRSSKQTVLVIVLFGLVFRLIGLTTMPAFEDDFNRYLWDGFQSATYGTPYAIAPADFSKKIPPELETCYPNINYPHLKTIYSPLLQKLFEFSYRLAPGSLMGFKALILGLEFIGILAIYFIFKLPPSAALLWWCPIWVIEVAFHAHFDGLGILILAASLLAYQNRWYLISVVGLGLAGGIRIFAFLLAPFFFKIPPQIYWIIGAGQSCPLCVLQRIRV